MPYDLRKSAERTGKREGRRIGEDCERERGRRGTKRGRGRKGDGVTGGKARRDDGGSDVAKQGGRKESCGVGVLEERTRGCVHVPSVLQAHTVDIHATLIVKRGFPLPGQCRTEKQRRGKARAACRYRVSALAESRPGD